MVIAKKVLSAIMVFFMMCFIIVGYASLTDELTVDGTVAFTPPKKGLFITDVSVVATSGGVTNNESTYVSPTNVISDVTVTQAGSVTYKITVENTSDATYWYREYIVLGDLAGYDNDLVVSGDITISTKDKFSDTDASFNNEDWVPPNTVREFYAMYDFGANAVAGTSGGEICTLVNFSFGEKLESYGDEVLAILNNEEKYEALKAAFDEAYAKTGSTVLANVGADKELLEWLFGSEMTLNGTPITIMIQRDNVDGDDESGDDYQNANGPRGCEYTFYITTGDGVVHAVSYAVDGESWRQIGELYDGTAGTASYTDSDGVTHNGVIDITTWEASEKTYTMFSYDGFTVEYTVGATNGDQFALYKTIEDLMGAKEKNDNIFNSNLYNQLDKSDMRDILVKVKGIIVAHPGSEEPSVVMLREAYNNLFPKYFYENNPNEIRPQQGGWTRAEIIAVLENLQKALEYYDQSHDTHHQ